MVSRVLLPLALGAIGDLALAFANLSPTGAIGTAGLVAFYLSLVLAGWMVLRPGLRWWIASVLGAVIGLVLGLMTLLATHNIAFCLFPPCDEVPTAFGLLFAINLGMLGLAQAITLGGSGRKLTWFVGNLLGGAAFGFGIQLSSSALHLGNQVVNYLPGLIGGLAWGIVLAVTMATLPRD